MKISRFMEIAVEVHSVMSFQTLVISNQWLPTCLESDIPKSPKSQVILPFILSKTQKPFSFSTLSCKALSKAKAEGILSLRRP